VSAGGQARLAWLRGARAAAGVSLFVSRLGGWPCRERELYWDLRAAAVVQSGVASLCRPFFFPLWCAPLQARAGPEALLGLILRLAREGVTLGQQPPLLHYITLAIDPLPTHGVDPRSRPPFTL
jgi:hypothetical protein